MRYLFAILSLLSLSTMAMSADLQKTDATGSAADPQAFPACQPSNPLRSHYPCLAIIEFKADVSDVKRDRIVADAKFKIRYNYARVAKANAVVIFNAEAMQTVMNDPAVKRVTPDRPIFVTGKQSNPTPTTSQVVPAGVKRIGAAPGVLPFTGKGVGLGLVDTGIDLVNRDLLVGAQCFTAFSDCKDGNGHGTHVSGIVAALNNNVDVVGVAPGATLYAIKVLDNTGSGSDATLLAGLEWVAANAALVSPAIRVLNVSLGRPGSLNDNPTLRQAFTTIKEMGITIVASAGNDPTVKVDAMVPGGYPEVLAVASTTAAQGGSQCRNFRAGVDADTASYFTTDGAFDQQTQIGITISAPGEEREDILRTCALSSLGILSLKNGGGTVRMSGTSMAAPHVTGVVALLIEQGGAISPDSIRTIIRASAFLPGVAPLTPPVTSYTFDGEREGILSACQAVGATCP